MRLKTIWELIGISRSPWLYQNCYLTERKTSGDHYISYLIFLIHTLSQRKKPTTRNKWSWHDIKGNSFGYFILKIQFLWKFSSFLCADFPIFYGHVYQMDFLCAISGEFIKIPHRWPFFSRFWDDNNLLGILINWLNCGEFVRLRDIDLLRDECVFCMINEIYMFFTWTGLAPLLVCKSLFTHCLLIKNSREKWETKFNRTSNQSQLRWKQISRDFKLMWITWEFCETAQSHLITFIKRKIFKLPYTTPIRDMSISNNDNTSNNK